MTKLEAHERLAAAHCESNGRLKLWLPFGVESVKLCPSLDTTVLLLTAAASLSGQLEDAKTLDDLEDACDHFATLWDGGLVSESEWTEEAESVLIELIRWGDRQTAEAN